MSIELSQTPLVRVVECCFLPSSLSPSLTQKMDSRSAFLRQLALIHSHPFPSRLSVVQLQEKELPELKNRLQAVNREMEKLKGDVEEQENLLATLMSQEEMAKACLQDVSLMDRYLVESR